MGINKTGVMNRTHTNKIGKSSDDADPDYVGRIYMRNISPFLVNNPSVRNILIVMEDFVQMSMDEIQKSSKMNSPMTRITNRLFD